jgi:hypothetical protein
MIRTMEAGAAQLSLLVAIGSYLRRLKGTLPALLAAKRNIFGIAADADIVPGKPCPNCQTLMPTRRRLCPKCAAAKQRESARVAMKGKRASELVLKAKTPIAVESLTEAITVKP